MKKILIAAIAASVIIGGGYIYHSRHADNLPTHIVGSNGRLELERFDVATLYGGRIEKIVVDEGSEVQTGDVLAQLSADTSAARVEEALAGEAQAREAAARAQAGVKQAREAAARADAQIAAQQQQLKVAQMELDNAVKLQGEQLVSSSETQRRRAQRDGAVAGVQAAQAAKAEAQAAVQQAQAAVGEAQAAIQRAQALVKTAQSADGDMSIKSPKSGRVEYRIVSEGSVVGAGSKIVSLLDPSDVSMNIFLPNAQAGSLKVGDEARIVLDGIDAVLPAQIGFIATDAQFTPKAVETQNERAKLMFKVKLKMSAETALQYNRLLKGGMPGNGYVRTDAQQPWPQELAVRLPSQ